jgi:MFS family permease
VSAAIFEVPTGIISDLVGRKKTVILGAVNSLLCLIFYAIGGSYFVLFTGAILQGLSRAFYSGNNDALLYDTLKENKKEHEFHFYLGKTSSMFQAALAIASLAGGFMANISFGLVMWASVIPQIFTTIFAFMLSEPKIVEKGNANIYEHLKTSLKLFLDNMKLRLLTGASVLSFSLGESAFFLRSAFVNTLWPIWAVGISYTISFVGGTLSFWFSGKAIEKYTPLKILKFEIIYNRIVNFIALLFPTVISPALMSSTSLTYGMGSVAKSTLLQKEFSDKQRATMGSLNSFAGSIAFGVFSFCLGIIADNFGLIIPLVIVQIFLIIPLLFYKEIAKR